MYLFLSFLTGITIVINMMLNAEASRKAGRATGLVVNYLSAVISSGLLCLIMFKTLPSYSVIKEIPFPFLLGGIIGVLTTYLFNIIVPNVPSFYVVVLRFIGQMLTSAVIDYLFFNTFSKGKLFGGILFLIGLLINTRADFKYNNLNH